MTLKIIAIRTLEIDDTNSAIYKRLQPNTLYTFLNDYKIEENSISYTPTIPNDFYKKGDKIDVNLSAVVGKNGSGKSSLIELFIRAINNLSHYFKINTDIEPINNLKLELFFLTNGYYRIRFDENINIEKQEIAGDSFQPVDKNEFGFQDLFYSIVVNYSLYGLNSLEIGGWINSLFHKNDGYQTPIVINPMRDDGKIDVNSERSLGISRLMSNILRPESITKQARITDDLYAWEVVLKLKENLNPELYSIKEDELDYSDPRNPKPLISKVRFNDLTEDVDELLRRLNERHNFSFNGHWKKGDKINDLAYTYAIRKAVKIAITYPFYEKYFDKEKRRFHHSTLNEFLDLIFKKNHNHISFKLIQTLNFIKFRHIPVDRINLNVSELAKSIDDTIQNHNLAKDAIIELIPPPIFSLNLILKSLTRPHEINFDSLSSGEKQQLFSVNSILYHLINLDSIDNSDFQKGYQNANIILDEIELYAHPNMQREYVNFILKRIQELSYKRLKAINICFITHSPFILSDIPDCNILFLDEFGAPVTKNLSVKTFGANIHKMLIDGFFMKHTIGDFALEKIKEIISFYQEVLVAKTDDLTSLVEQYSARAYEFAFIAESIGEDYIRGVAKNHIEFITSKLKMNDTAVNNRIAFLEKELEKLKADRDAQNPLP